MQNITRPEIAAHERSRASQSHIPLWQAVHCDVATLLDLTEIPTEEVLSRLRRCQQEAGSNSIACLFAGVIRQLEEAP